MVFEVVQKGLNPNERVLVDKHLNLDGRYNMVNDIITHKTYHFHTQKIPPNIAICQNGKCSKELCNAPEAGFEAARKNNSPLGNLWDKAIGKKVLIDENGEVTFCHPDGDNIELDLNWKKLRSMDMPIMDNNCLGL